MDTKIKATDVYFGEFHRKASEIFYIPSLQRPYSWEAKKQVDRLWDDIIENNKPYYIGSIVSILGSGSISKDQIIDGQQRLTTLYLMLAGLRDCIIESKEKDLKDVVSAINNFLIRYSDDGKQIRLSFSNEGSDNVYRTIITGDGDLSLYNSETQKKFIKNYVHIKTRIKEYCGRGKQRLTRFLDIFDRIKNLQLIFIECLDKSAAFRLFESINATGIDLTTNDLIKNSIFEFLFDDKKGLLIVEAGWKSMIEEFNENSSVLKTYIRHHWISTVDYTSHSVLFDDFLKKYTDKESVFKYARSLYDLAPVYNAMRNGNVEILGSLNRNRTELNDVKELLKFLSFLGVDQVYSVLLNLYIHEPEKFKKDLIRLVAFQFIFKHIPGSPSLPEKKFANFCSKKISKSQLMNELVNICRGKEVEFSKKLVEKSKYIGGSSGDIQFILERYMYYYGEPLKFADPTIEHIIPQDPKDDVYKLFDSDAKQILKKINSIGNLTILERSDNSSDKTFNQDFDKKYKFYDMTLFKANKKILKYKFDVNPEKAIDERSNDVAKDLYKIFFEALQTGKWPRK